MSEPGASPRVVVIDDEPQIRRFLRISLKSQGYPVLEAETAAAGLELVAVRAPDVVLLASGSPTPTARRSSRRSGRGRASR